MKRKILILIMLLVSTLGLTSCVKEKVNPPTKPSLDIPIESDPIVTPTETTDPNPEGEAFTVKLMYGGKPVAIKPEEEIMVIWDSLDGTVIQAPVDASGVATARGLDGDFFVHLNKAPKGYTYFPNDGAHYVSNDFRDLEIEMHRVTPIRSGNGKGLYTAYVMNKTGYYSATVNKDKIVYYDFVPPKPGTYYFESLVDCYNDDINPIAHVHIGTFANKPERPSRIVDEGGFSLPGGYTKNFKLKFTISEDEMGNIYTFGIKVDSKNKVYPNRVDFLVLHSDEYENNEIPKGTPTVPQELDKAKITHDISGKTLYNADFGHGTYYVSGRTNGTGILDGTKFKYKADEGIYYLYDNVNDKYLAPLVAYITKPCPFYPNEPDNSGADGALSNIQAAGNTALTVFDENGNRLNYSDFIEKQYAGVANSNKDGCVYVTKELKDFLQMFTNRNKLFMDGNGWCEGYGVYSNGEDQWLFDCGFYWEGPLPF